MCFGENIKHASTDDSKPAKRVGYLRMISACTSLGLLAAVRARKLENSSEAHLSTCPLATLFFLAFKIRSTDGKIFIWECILFCSGHPVLIYIWISFFYKVFQSAIHPFDSPEIIILNWIVLWTESKTSPC